MRQYRHDSPQAAARVVAVCLLADGRVNRHELEASDRDRVGALFALPQCELHAVLQAMREDLASTAHRNWRDACRNEPAIVRRLASEICDPALMLEIVEYCEARAAQRTRATFGIVDTRRRVARAAGMRMGAPVRRLRRRPGPKRRVRSA
jgi:hypothetical protein